MHDGPEGAEMTRWWKSLTPEGLFIVCLPVGVAIGAILWALS